MDVGGSEIGSKFMRFFSGSQKKEQSEIDKRLDSVTNPSNNPAEPIAVKGREDQMSPFTAYNRHTESPFTKSAEAGTLPSKVTSGPTLIKRP